METARHALGSEVLIIPSDASDVTAQHTVARRLFVGSLEAWMFSSSTRGLQNWKPVEQWDEHAFDHCFATNLKGPFFSDSGSAAADLRENPASVVLNAPSVNAHIRYG